MNDLTATKLTQEKEVEQQFAGILIIEMNGCSDDVVAEQAREAGMNFFVPKP